MDMPAIIDTLRTKDLIPFDKAIAVGAPAIMVTHAAVPGLTQAGEPASLSAAAITGACAPGIPGYSPTKW